MDYSTLVADRSTPGSIAYNINYGRIDADGILDEAEAWIYAKLRVRQMRSTASVSIAASASTASFPTGYLDPIHFGIPGYCTTLRRWDEERFRAHLGWDESAVLPTGMPTVWADISETMQFNSIADQAYTGQMTYYKLPTALSADNETNWLTTRYPTLVRRACLIFSAEARKEFDVRDRAEKDALQQIMEIRVESDESMRGMSMDFHWGSDDEYTGTWS